MSVLYFANYKLYIITVVKKCNNNNLKISKNVNSIQQLCI